MSFAIGDTVGAYRIIGELGRGGMGRVYKVEHTITRRLEAMKVLEGGRPGEPEQAARSLREIQVQARLDHPNIAAVHNAFWADDDLILVMELIEGFSLRHVMEAGRVPLAAAIDYACQALSSLHYAHAHGVIHRDVSPANMMVDSAGVLKLTDFGLAKELADVPASRSGAPLGSVYYMSPEQVRGGAEADVRSDIYSLGAVLYELATGQRPFDGESAFCIMADHIGKPPVPPIEVEPSLPQPLNSAILQSLEKDPARRFPSAARYLETLSKLQDARVASEPPSPASVPRSGVVWAAALVTLGGLAASLFISEWLDSPGDRPAMASNHRRDGLDREHPYSPHRARQVTHTPPKTTGPAVSKPHHNGFVKALGKLWPLRRHKKSSTENAGSARTSGS